VLTSGKSTAAGRAANAPSASSARTARRNTLGTVAKPLAA
jgi:hypothetical protein